MDTEDTLTSVMCVMPLPVGQSATKENEDQGETGQPSFTWKTAVRLKQVK